MTKTKILYVEDQPFLGRIVKESLESRGYEVVMESDGADVMQTFKRINPEVCVLDVMLPNKDGFTLAGEIRAIDEKVPIIFLTAKTQTDDLVKGCVASLVYATVFFSLAWWRFLRKDVVS